jgi:hypothetical protein
MRDRNKRATGPRRAARPRIEGLEDRRLLSGSSGDSSADTSPGHELETARQAALIAFDGPDLAGKDGPMGRIGFDLALLFQEQKLHDSLHPGTPFTPSNSLLAVTGTNVSVDAVARGDAAALATSLRQLGMTHIVTAGPVVEGDLPIAALEQFAALKSLGFASPVYRPITAAGSVEDQGDKSMQSDLARATFGVDGTGITVGVISDSFNQVSYPNGAPGMATDIASGDLPAQTTILEDAASGTDEGRGMAQIVHDVAPGAAIQFATGEGGQAHFAANIRALAAAGAGVIVDDLTYLAEPFFQDGLVSQAVDQVAASGVAYFSHAQNNSDHSYESAFRSSGQAGPRGGTLHDFDPGPGVSTLQEVTILPGVGAPFILQWDQPFGSLGGANSTSDVDIYILGADGTTVLASGIVDNIGGDPLEITGIFNDGSIDLDGVPGPDSKFFVRMELVSGPAPGILKYTVFTNGAPFTVVSFPTNSSTNYGHANSAGGLGVAAAPFYATPPFGSTLALEEFSSRGGTPILFDTSGARLTSPVLRGSPQITGPDEANTTFFGSDISQDTDSLPNFGGTSAASPHVAAVAALMLQAAGGNGSLTPSQIFTAMQQSAIDVQSRFDIQGNVVPIPNGEGVDVFSGAGLIDAVAAIQIVSSGVQINDVTMVEGDAGFTLFVFTISLASPTALPVTVTFDTANGTAVAPADYIAASGVLTFTPGDAISQPVTVRVVGDAVSEPNESFFVRILEATNTNIRRSGGIGTILNDDINVAINDVTVIEGDSGTANAVFTVKIDSASAKPASVMFMTTDDTATGGTDFVPVGGVLAFPAFATSGTITVPIIGDNRNEGPERFFVTLFSPVNLKILDPNGTGTIIDNDPLPALYVNDVQVTPTADGLAAVFSVGLDLASGRNVTVNFTTLDGTATAGQDYQTRAGVLTFAPGVNTMQVTVPIAPSAVAPPAPNERFFLALSNPNGASLADPEGTATLVFTQPPVAEYIVDDGDPGYRHSFAGWTNVTNLVAYNLDYEHHAAGNGSGTATWAFADLPVGNYQIFTKWVPFSNRATNAPYTIFDEATPLATVLVNQQLAPAGDRVNNVTWQSLGTYQIVNGSLSVRLADNANGFVIADAVRLVPDGIPAQVPEIDVSASGRSITLGDPAPSLDKGTHFGGVLSTTDSPIKTFAVSNTGNAPLLISDFRLEGNDPQDFVIVSRPDSTVAPGRSTTFQILFHPTLDQERSARVVIVSNDQDEPTYSFTIGGTGTSGPIATPLVQNAALPADVNADGKITALDAVLVISRLLVPRSTAKTPTATTGLATGALTASAPTKPYYLDVNGDGRLSALDAVLVIRHLMAPKTTSMASVAMAPAAAPSPAPTVVAVATAPAVSTGGLIAAPPIVQPFVVDQAITQMTSASQAAPPLPTSSSSAAPSQQPSSSTSALLTPANVQATFSADAETDADEFADSLAN